MKTLLAIAIALGTLAGGHGSPATPAACAHRLGITWTVEAGATDRLDGFSACVGR